MKKPTMPRLLARLMPMMLILGLFVNSPAHAQDGKLWVTYPGGEGPGQGKHIVLVSGDDEYRSEEALPMLGKILSVHHGFTCTVLFAIDPATGEIKPDYQQNIPGLAALADADLMIIATRFRDLPDEQMKPIDDYVRAGKPIVGMRTATHAFNLKSSETYKKYSWRSSEGWKGGFGKHILGETWITHHGHHGKESTRGIIADGAKDHAITRGIKPKTVWGKSDVYTVNLPLPGDAKPIVLGAVLTGMNPDDPILVDQPGAKKQKNNPMMPVAWTKTYRGDKGETGRVFTTTMGAATDLASEGSRRMIVNGVYWALGMEDKIPAQGTNVDLVGEYKPTDFGMKKFKPGMTPADYALKTK